MWTKERIEDFIIVERFYWDDNKRRTRKMYKKWFRENPDDCTPSRYARPSKKQVEYILDKLYGEVKNDE